MPKKSGSMKRRRFVQLVALSGAAVLTNSLGRAAAPSRRTPAASGRAAAAGHHPLTPAIRKEIANQEKSLAEQLRTIRGYELLPGSPMAFVFEPIRAKRRT
jgi:hypothetical protein